MSDGSKQRTILHTSLAIAWWILGLECLKSQHSFWLRAQFCDINLGWVAWPHLEQSAVGHASTLLFYLQKVRLFSHHRKALLQEWLGMSQSLAREINPSGDGKDVGRTVEEHPLGPAAKKTMNCFFGLNPQKLWHTQYVKCDPLGWYRMKSFQDLQARGQRVRHAAVWSDWL